MSRRRMNAWTGPWAGIAFDAWRLGLEASGVVGLRALKLAQGDAAEATRMVAEKVDAGLTIQRLAMTGALGRSPASASARTLAFYRRKVKANRRRLMGA